MDTLHHTQVRLPCLFRYSVSPYDYLYLSEWGSRSLISLPIGLAVPRRVFPTLDELLQIPLLDEGLDLLLKVVAFESIMYMVPVETAVLVPRPFVRVSLQFV